MVVVSGTGDISRRCRLCFVRDRAQDLDEVVVDTYDHTDTLLVGLATDRCVLFRGRLFTP